MLNARGLGSKQQSKSEVAPPSLETEVRADPELERHGKTPGSTIHGTTVSGDGFEEDKSSSTRSMSDNDVGTSVLKGSEGLQGLGSSGGQEGDAFSVMEKQPPGSPFQVQPTSWNLWQQPSKVPRSSPCWPHPRQTAVESTKAFRPQECQGFLPETTVATVATTTSKTELINARIDQASRVACAACPASAVNTHPQHVDATVDNQVKPVQPPDGCAIDKINHGGGPCLVSVVDATGRDGNNAHALLPRRKSSDVVVNTAGERAYTSRKQAGIPPRCRSMETVNPGGMTPRLVGVEREGQHCSPPKKSSGGRGRTRESKNLSARAASAAAAAAAVLNDDGFRRKSESDVEAMYHNRLALTTEQGHAATVAPDRVGPGSRGVSGGDRLPTPLRKRTLFSSREAWAQGKGPKIIDYFKGSRSAAGAERSNSNGTIPQGMPTAHAPLRARSPASTPGTRGKGSASSSFSTPRRWRPRSISRRRPDPDTQPEKRPRGEGQGQGQGQGQTVVIPSGGPETAAAAGIVSSVIPATCPGDGNPHTLSTKDHDVPVIGCDDDANNSDDDKAAKSEGTVVMVVVDRSEGEVKGAGKEGDALAAVAPEELEAENAFEEEEEKEKKEDEVEDVEDEEEPEAVVSKTCSFTGILECGRSLRVHGKIVGEVLSSGSVIVGPTGSITGDLRSIKFLLVDGQVNGNVFCDRVVITKAGKVIGNVTSESISISPQATIRGKLDVVESISEARTEAQTSAAQPLTVEAESTMAQDRTTAGPSVASEGEGMTAQSCSTTTGGEALKSVPVPVVAMTRTMTPAGSAKQEATAVEEKDGSNEMKVAAVYAEQETKPAYGEGWNSQDQEAQHSDFSTVAEGGVDLRIPDTDTAAEVRSAKAEIEATMREAKAAIAAAETKAEIARTEDAGLPESRQNPGQAADGGNAAVALRPDSAEAEHAD